MIAADAEQAALRAAWQRLVPWHVGDGAVGNLTATGWTAAGVAGIGVVARAARPRSGEALIEWLTRLLAETAEGLAWAGLPVGEAFGWLAVVAGAPDEQEAARLLLAVRSTKVAGVRQMDRWRAAAGPLAPLAWAAGLSIEEAETRRAVGTPTEDGLRTMAGLRGYRLPEFEIPGVVEFR